jgi:hypothetical protein
MAPNRNRPSGEHPTSIGPAPNLACILAVQGDIRAHDWSLRDAIDDMHPESVSGSALRGDLLPKEANED